MDPEKVVTIKLLLVRHGETDDNHIKVICGHRATNLTELGVEQAQKTGAYLQNHTFDQIFVSDLLRTKQTYQSILENAPNLEKIHTDFIALIRERCGGVLEG
jgi:broad specificity phosphatase PhoE